MSIKLIILCTFAAYGIVRLLIDVVRLFLKKDTAVEAERVEEPKKTYVRPPQSFVDEARRVLREAQRNSYKTLKDFEDEITKLGEEMEVDIPPHVKEAFEKMDSMPNMPRIPDIPDIPDIPKIPDIPDIPRMPKIPKMPEMPRIKDFLHKEEIERPPKE